jgi:membrane-bound metal-dependent hydrolase YbcI (DUF457 family)
MAIAGRKKWSVWLVVLFVLLSNLPDFDFFPGWLIGQPNLFHRGASHSLLLAFVIGLSAGVTVKIVRGGRFVPVLMTVFILYTMHVVLDLFSADYSTMPGFQILWPFSNEYYIAPSVIFTNITRSPIVEEFVPSLFNSHNLRAIVNEVIIFTPPILLLWGLMGREKSPDGSIGGSYNQPEVDAG